MDAVSQIVLGASVTALCAPAERRRSALLLGALLGTLPDLDALPLALLDDPVAQMVWHRSASHSLLVLPFVGLALWAALARWWKPAREARARWFVAVQLALVTHPLLDALTVYGTQLWWPLRPPPTMVSSVFIIDPLYTVWLTAGCTVAWFLRARYPATLVLAAGLAVSTAYLGWSLVAKALVEREAEAALAELGLEDAPRFSVPMPFNTLLWRVVAMTPDGFVEGTWSLVVDEAPMRFERHASDVEALRACGDVLAVRRLAWFNHGFMKAEVHGERLVLSDLRMGVEPDYVFVFEVAERRGGEWHAIPPVQRAWPREALVHLGAMWDRIWTPLAH